MLVELTKKQIKSALDEYIDECMDTESFGKFIQGLVRRYDRWDGANTSELLGKFVKNKTSLRKEKQPQGFVNDDV